MNIRENYICACRGGKPDWIPNYMESVAMFAPEILKDPNVTLYGMLEAYGENRPEKLVAKDCFGIPWQLDDFGPMVQPGTCLFEEIDDWRGNFIIPSTEGIDWDEMCRNDSRFLDGEKAVQMGFYGQFTQLYNAMGFENAMIAVFENPHEVKALFKAMTDFLVEVQEEVMKRVRIDSIALYDGIADSNNLFISKQTYVELVKPFHRQIFESAKKMNPEISLEMHCCGHCDLVIDDFVDIGTNVWQPAQTLNNLQGIREKYGEKLVFNGAWDNIAVFSNPDITEEAVRQSVRDSIDHFGRNGGLIFWDQQLGEGPEMMKKLVWINDELEKYS